MNQFRHLVVTLACMFGLAAQDPLAAVKQKIAAAELRLQRAELNRDRAKLAVKAAASGEARKAAEEQVARLEKECAQLALEVESAKLDARSAELEGKEEAVRKTVAQEKARAASSVGLAETLPKAQADDVDAQYQVGMIFFEPRGVDRDLTQAAAWFAKAAAQGHTRAATRLGRLYLDTTLLWPGRGAEGLRLLSLASGKGDGEATVAMARAAVEPQKQVELHKRAIEQGSIEGRFWLGTMLIDGNGVPKDQAEGLRQIEMARRSGDVGVLVLIARAQDYGWFGTKNPVEATRTYGLAAAQGSAEAEYELGWRLLRGEGAAKDATEGVRLLRSAASRWNPDAQRDLGIALVAGEELPQDADEGARLLGLAAAQGDSWALAELAGLMLDGIHVAPDSEKGISYLLRAVEDNDRGAKVRLAVELLVGKHVKRDPVTARRMIPPESYALTDVALSFRVAYTRPVYAAGMDAGEAVKMQELFEKAIRGDEKPPGSLASSWTGREASGRSKAPTPSVIR